MTPAVLERAPSLESVAAEPEAPAAEETGAGSSQADGRWPQAPKGATLPSPLFVSLSAVLSALGAAWMTGGLLDAPYAARAFGAAGAILGALVAWYSFRTSNTSLVQYLLLPAALVGGAIAISPNAGSGTQSLSNLLGDVLHGGGLLQTPVPFEPGWRFILVVVFALLTGCAVTMSVGLRRPRLCVVIPLPVTIGASLIQPKGTATTAGIVALLLTIVALGVGYGADLAASTGTANARFELRRMRRAGIMMLGVAVALVALSQLNLLFPDTNNDRVYPPQKPPSVPLESDHVVFTVSPKLVGPWRLGVLDIYDGTGWLLPPYDVSREVKPAAGGAVPDAVKGKSSQVTFTIGGIQGRSLPVPAELQQVQSSDDLQYDPRTSVPVASHNLSNGFTYTAVVAPTPNADQMNAATADPAMVQQFGPSTLPPAPQAVIGLLSQAPSQPFDRLQFLRDKLYQTVVAKGEGTPIDISPARVEQMLQPGTTATPFEITAAEAMLARWAGEPARLGYGYYSGSENGNVRELHPRDGAAWLEVYYKGYGWVPLVGVPPRAVSSLDLDDQNNSSAAQPAGQLVLSVFILQRQTSALFLFELVRFFALVALGIAAGAALLWFSFPVICKALRRERRSRWAHRHGPMARIEATYAEMRDLCIDLNIADRAAPPLAFRTSFVADQMHDELAWLVTRALWGDLRRGLADEDAEAAERMASAMRSRIAAEQEPINRMLATISRVSLRDPYSDTVPNLWPRISIRVPNPLRPMRGLRPRMPRRRRAAGTAAAVAATLISVLIVAGCGSAATAAGGVRGTFPAQTVPATLLGYQVRREPTAEQAYVKAGSDSEMTQGMVWTIRKGDVIQGSIQLTLLAGDVDTRDATTRTKVLAGIKGVFQPYRVGSALLEVSTRPELRVYVYFPIERNSLELIVVRREFTDAENVLTALMLYQHGGSAADLQTLPDDVRISPTPGPSLAPLGVPGDVGGSSPAPPSSASPAPSPMASPTP